MPSSQHTLPSFSKGLDLLHSPDVIEPGFATDLADVDFSAQGALRRRAGYDEFTTSALTNRPDSLAAFYKTDATSQLLVGAGTRLEVLDTAGAVVGTSLSGLAGGPWTFARFGTP